MAFLLPTLVCPYCSSPPNVILLPYPNPPQISEGLPQWPRSDWKANIGCHQCGSVFVCSAQGTRVGFFEKHFLDQLHSYPRFFRFDIECVEPNCVTPIQVHIYTGLVANADDVQRLLTKKETLTQPEVRCPSGHSMKEPRNVLGVRIEKGPIE